MFQSTIAASRDGIARLRARYGDRTLAWVLAILCEILIGLLLLSLASPVFRGQPDQSTSLRTFDVAPPAPAPEPEKPQAPAAKAPPPPQSVQRPDQPQPQPQPNPAPVQPMPKPPVLLQLTPDQMAATDISRPSTSAPSTPAPVYGPTVDPRYAIGANDTPRVGTAPNGEPMYAAEWYREPTHEELAGYLSAAKGEGWGMIACKTAPNWRVVDCVPIDEYPKGSMIAQSVAAAAYQFRVRPPKIHGRYQVGSWVRIRIDYTITRQEYDSGPQRGYRLRR